MSHLTNEIAAPVGIDAALSVAVDKNVSETAAIGSGSSNACSRAVAAPASTKDFGRVRIGGCCIRY